MRSIKFDDLQNKSGSSRPVAAEVRTPIPAVAPPPLASPKPEAKGSAK